MAACPYCSERGIRCHVGTLPGFSPEEGLIPVPEPRMVSFHIYCDCNDFGVYDYDGIERAAIERYLANRGE
jgi:hypothetical protein